MLAQVLLTPTESKRIISKAVARLDIVKEAQAAGTIVLHPCSDTYFLIEELTGKKPWTDVWVCGVVVPKALCNEIGPRLASYENPETRTGKPNPNEFPHTWVIKQGQLSIGEPLSKILEGLGPQDVYIKGVNAIDCEGNVGTLIGNPVGGGTISKVMKASRKRGFKIIYPVGLEKLVPFPVKDVAKEARKKYYEYGMGIACGLLPCRGIVVNELRAIELLSGATAVPIAAGGLGGAEGAIVLVIKGQREKVEAAIKYVEESKGAKLPQLRTANCHDCRHSHCKFPVKDKPWL